MIDEERIFADPSSRFVVKHGGNHHLETFSLSILKIYQCVAVVVVKAVERSTNLAFVIRITIEQIGRK